jgi:hypothetical protein
MDVVDLKVRSAMCNKPRYFIEGTFNGWEERKSWPDHDINGTRYITKKKGKEKGGKN